MQDPSKPIWFKKPEEVENINKEEKITHMVCTPVHSE